MKRKIFAGSTSVALPIFVQDTSSATGSGLGSLVFNTAGLVAEYRRKGSATWTSISLVTNTLGTYISGGFIADGSLAGAYEFCPPNAAVAAGVTWVVIRLYGAANMLPVLIEIELDAVNYQDAVAFGLTNLDAAISSRSTFAGGAVSSVTGNVGGNVVGSVASVTAAITLPTIPTDWIAAAGVKADAVTKIQAGLGTSASQTSILNAVNAITTNTARGMPIAPTFLARPSTSSTAFEIDLNVYSLQGILEAPDAAPTIHARDASGASLDAGLTSTTMTLVSTGKYKATYTVNSTDAAGEAFFDFTWAVGGQNFAASVATMIEDADSLATWAAIKAKTDLIPASPASTTNITGGTVTTVTNLTNLPAVPTDWLTAAGVKADAVTKIQAGLSTYAGADTGGTTTLLTRLTNTRAGLLDNLDAAISTRSTFAGGAVASVTGNVGGNVVGSVASVTAPVTVGTNSDKTGYSLAGAGLDSIVTETGLNLRQAMSLNLANAAGTITTDGSGNVTIKGAGVATTRITATTSGNNRTVTIIPPA